MLTILKNLTTTQVNAIGIVFCVWLTCGWLIGFPLWYTFYMPLVCATSAAAGWVMGWMFDEWRER